MEGNYCEARAKKLTTPKDTLTKAGIIALIVISILAAMLTGYGLILLISVGLGIFAYFYFPRLKVEYEYVFCDGQLDIDKIMNGEKRKHLERFDMDQVVVCAPRNSHTLDGYKHNGVRKLDYSSGDPNAKIWAAVVSGNMGTVLYYFEPGEEMIGKMKQKSPRKISEY